MSAWDTGERGRVRVGEDVEEFAALLRRLKDRTDRSYGSLARRLNMNTSTLHRYCAGEAVPLDFAPVERLAAFCGASPHERLELHERWLRAVAARQRPRAAAIPSPEEPGPAEPVEPVEPAESAQSTESAELSAPDRISAETETEIETEAGTDGEPGAVPQSVSAVVPRPWYRRRRTLVGSAVALVLLVTLGTLIAPSDDRPSNGAPARSAASSPTAAGDARHPRPASPSTSTSTANSPNVSASPGRRSASPAPDGTKAPASGAPGTHTTPAPTGVPLAWTADSQIWELGCDHDYVIGKQPAQVPPPPVPQDAGTWAATQDAVHGHDTIVQISVQGRSSTAVVLEDLRVRVAGRTTPAPGVAYSMADGCGGGLTPRYFDVDLDKDRPLARPVAGQGPDGRTVSTMRLPYRVSSTDPEVLRVQAHTEGCDCRWYLELDWSSQGRSGTLRIDDHGRPFRTSSIKGLPHYWYGFVDGVRRWVPVEG
ncbi:helix-turn-helix domain-containing protein [Streptomyces sp. NPDC001068]|uniref:helix-turn-helix domain-containing protein n=1 Tax=Streptomyces sp. NPDC001068 TaxID=3364544 RepID=UPI003684CB57